MRKMLFAIVPFLLLAAMPLTASAAVTDLFAIDGTKNTVKFVNREILMRESAPGSGVWAPVTSPNALVGGVTPGDVLVTIFSATDILVGQDLTNVWTAGTSVGGTPYLLGYSAQEVATVTPLGVFGTTAFVNLTYSNATADPFGILGAGEQVKIWNSTVDWDINTGGAGLANLTTSVTNTTVDLNAANLWETFAIADADDFADSTGTVQLLNNNVNLLASYGLSALGDSGLTFLQNDWLGRGVTNDIGGNATIKFNLEYDSGVSPWMYDSNDPLVFAAVPEPATLAMWGGFLAIGAVVALRRRQK